MKAFGWSLRDIDDTDIGSLIPFIVRLGQSAGDGSRKKYADEVDWL